MKEPKVESLKKAKDQKAVIDLKAQINAAQNVPDIRAALKALAEIVLGK